ncbi:MAG: hypothetical protein PHV68_02340 [Candidatus Gastranaerophilales bacterium]|nr:hypothetical protein [Candidatus Gastranaerophilales bacterium]
MKLTNNLNINVNPPSISQQRLRGKEKSEKTMSNRSTETSKDNIKLNKSAQVNFGGFFSPASGFLKMKATKIGGNPKFKNFVAKDKFKETFEYISDSVATVETMLGLAISLTIKPYSIMQMNGEKKDKENAAAKCMASALIDLGLTGMLVEPVKKSFIRINNVIQKANDDARFEVAKNILKQKNDGSTIEKKINSKLEQNGTDLFKKGKNIVEKLTAEARLKVVDEILENSGNEVKEFIDNLRTNKLKTAGIINDKTKYLANPDNFKAFKYAMTYAPKLIITPIRAALSILMIPITLKIVFGDDIKDYFKQNKKSPVNFTQNNMNKNLFKDFIGAKK